MREEKKAHWIIVYFDLETLEYHKRIATDEDTCVMFCSNCKQRALLNSHEDYVPSNFCPNCGKEMEVSKREVNDE